MTHKHLEGLNGQEANSEVTSVSKVERRTKGMQGRAHDNVLALTGEALDNAAATDALYRVTDAPARSTKKIDTKEAESMREIEQLLADMADLASELSQKALEHRVEDWRDNLPVFSNIRSHRLATREGHVIQQLKNDLIDLRAQIQETGVAIDITDIATAIDKLKVPAGFTKAVATLIPPLRSFHRGVVAPRNERVKELATNLKRQARDLRKSWGLAA